MLVLLPRIFIFNPYQANVALIQTSQLICTEHIETSQLICTAYRLTGFYMSLTLA